MVTNADMDVCAWMIGYGMTLDDIKGKLTERGLSDYDAFLCYKGTMLLVNAGFYDKDVLCSHSHPTIPQGIRAVRV